MDYAQAFAQLMKAKELVDEVAQAKVAEELDFLAYSPVIYVSARTGFEVDDILGAALDVAEQLQRVLARDVEPVGHDIGGQLEAGRRGDGEARHGHSLTAGGAAHREGATRGTLPGCAS